MPSNSSSRLNTTSGCQSAMVMRSSAMLSSTPSARTSCPPARSVWITSYSVRHSATDLESCPSRLSGGIRLGCSTTSTRDRFMVLLEIQRGSLPLAEYTDQTAQQPAHMRSGGALRTAQVQVEVVRTIDRDAQHLLRGV